MDVFKNLTGYFMATPKIKNAVLLTDDEKMHFLAKEVGGVGFGFNLRIPCGLPQGYPYVVVLLYG